MQASSRLHVICIIWFISSLVWAGPIVVHRNPLADLFKRHMSPSGRIVVATVTVTVTAVSACTANVPVSPANQAGSVTPASTITLSPIPQSTSTFNNNAESITIQSGQIQPGFSSIDVNNQFIPSSTTSVAAVSAITSTTTSSTFSASVSFISPDFYTSSSTIAAAVTDQSAASLSTASTSIPLGFGSVAASDAFQPAATSTSDATPAISPGSFFTYSSNPPPTVVVPTTTSSSDVGAPSAVLTSSVALGFGTVAATAAVTFDPSTVGFSNSGSLGIGRR